MDYRTESGKSNKKIKLIESYMCQMEVESHNHIHPVVIRHIEKEESGLCSLACLILCLISYIFPSGGKERRWYLLRDSFMMLYGKLQLSEPRS